MERVIMMSEVEYYNLMERIEELEDKLELAMRDIEATTWRADDLWDALNRPAIEAAAEAHENEFYAWCNEKAAEYEKKDEEEWCVCRARFYNNGIAHYCACHSVSEEEAEEDKRWYDVMEYTWNAEKSEGWSDLPRYKYTASWIMSHAWDDAWERYIKTNNKKYRHLVDTFDEQCEESYCLGNDCHEYYR